MDRKSDELWHSAAALGWTEITDNGGQSEHGSKDFELFLNREDSNTKNASICNMKTFYLKKILGQERDGERSTK